MRTANKISWRNAFDKIMGDDILTQAAALAFYMGSAVVPLFVLMISVLALLDQNLVDQMALRIRDVVGDDASQIFQAVSSAAHHQPRLSSWSGMVGILVLLISTSVIFRQMEAAFSLIFKQKKSSQNNESTWSEIGCFFKRQIFAALTMLIFLGLTIGSLAVSVSLRYSAADGVWIFKALNIVFDLIVYTLLFGCIFKILLLRPVKFADCLTVGFFVALFFAFGKDAISLYLKTSAVNSAYGAAGFPMALFVWLYYSSLVVFFGAEALAIFRMRPHEKA